MKRMRCIKQTILNGVGYARRHYTYTTYELFDNDGNYICTISRKYLWDIVKFLNVGTVMRHEYIVNVTN